MKGAGAAGRREEQEPPPDAASVEAGLRRVIAGSEAVQRSLRRHGRAAAAELAALRHLAAECPNAERLAAAADRLAARYDLVAVELISDAAHNAEAREACEAYVQTAAFTEAMRAAAFEAGRQAGIAEEQARQPRASRGRHAARSRHLKVMGGIAAGSAVAASLVAPAVIAAQDSAAVHHWSPGPVAARFHVGPADSAVLMPQSSSFPSPRPSAAAASARPAPAVTARPSAPVPPPAPSASAPETAPVPPALSVPRFLDLGASIRGELALTAGPQAVTWTATTTDGITLSSFGGVALPGQAVTVEVTDPTGDGGWVYVSAGTEMFAVHVTSTLGPSA